MITKKIVLIILLATVTVGSIATLYIIKNNNKQEPIVQEVAQQNQQDEPTQEIDNEVEEPISEKQKLANEGYDLIEFDTHVEDNQEETEDEHDTSVDKQESHIVTQEEITVTKEGEIEIKLDQGNNSTEIVYDEKNTTE